MTYKMQVLSAKDVCELTSIKRSSIFNWVRDGNFPPPMKLGPKKRGWLAKDVEKWLLSKRQKPA